MWMLGMFRVDSSVEALTVFDVAVNSVQSQYVCGMSPLDTTARNNQRAIAPNTFQYLHILYLWQATADARGTSAAGIKGTGFTRNMEVMDETTKI